VHIAAQRVTCLGLHLGHSPLPPTPSDDTREVSGASLRRLRTAPVRDSSSHDSAASRTVIAVGVFIVPLRTADCASERRPFASAGAPLPEKVLRILLPSLFA